MEYINETTGERATGHCVGVNDSGHSLYSVPYGWKPVEPYWLDYDGYAIEGECEETDIDPSPMCRCETCPIKGPFTCIGGKDD